MAGKKRDGNKEYRDKEEECRQIHPKHFSRRTKEELSKHFHVILRRAIEEACQGSLRHADWLFELAQIAEILKQPQGRRNRRPMSLAAILMSDLKGKSASTTAGANAGQKTKR